MQFLTNIRAVTAINHCNKRHLSQGRTELLSELYWQGSDFNKAVSAEGGPQSPPHRGSQSADVPHSWDSGCDEYRLHRLRDTVNGKVRWWPRPQDH